MIRPVSTSALATGLLALLCAAPLPSAYAESCPTSVQLTYGDGALPPFILGNRSEVPSPPGLAVEWVLSAIAKTRCKPEVRFLRLPVRRIDSKTEPMELIIIAPTPERLHDFRFPGNGRQADNRFALIKANLAFFGKAHAASRWKPDGTLTPGSAVGVFRGSYPELYAKQQGWTSEPAASSEANFQKLMLGRIDLTLEVELVGDNLIKQPDMKGLVKLEPPVLSAAYFVAAGSDFYQTYPAFTEEFWRNICALKHAYKPKSTDCRR